MNSFFLIRHGEAENNVLRLLDAVAGNPEYSLTEKGRGQVKKTAEYLAPQKIDFIVSSPILRAKETAEMLREVLSVPLTFDERLTEARVGAFENQSLDLFLDYMEKLGGRLAGRMEEGIEGYVDIRTRIQQFLGDVGQSFNGKRIAIVSHGDPLQEMYGELMGIGSRDSEGGDGWYPKHASCMLVSKEKNEEYVP